MSTYALQGPAHAGSMIAMSAPGGTAGDVTPTGTGVGLLMNNAGASTITVTLPFVKTWDNQGVTARTFSLAPGIGILPLPSDVYGAAPQQVQYSGTASLTVASVRIPS